MSRYKSVQAAYNPLKKKDVPIWRLDINTVNVTHFDVDTQTEGSKTYHTNFIRYHLHFSDSHCPDRLRRLVNEDRIEQYLDDMKLKVGEAISCQMELWKQTDSCYQKATLSGDTEKMLGLENCFVHMARKSVFECMVYLIVYGCASGYSCTYKYIFSVHWLNDSEFEYINHECFFAFCNHNLYFLFQG